MQSFNNWLLAIIAKDTGKLVTGSGLRYLWFSELLSYAFNFFPLEIF